MGNEWRNVNVREISEDVSYGYTESANEEKVGPKFLRITDIQGGVVNWKSVPYCPIEKKNFKKYQLKKGDIVVARTGNSTGENYLFSSDEDAVFASYLIRIRVKPEVDAKYVWYNMRSKRWWGFIQGNKTGSAQAGANAKLLQNFELKLPPLHEQKAIAYILGSLDDKIELNRQMNETLEQMAQALFQSWFVDFDPVIDNMLATGAGIDDFPEPLQAKAHRRQALGNRRKPLPDHIQSLFPASFIHTEQLGWIPEGWEIKRIYDLMSITYGAPFKSNLFNSNKEGLPIIRIRDLKTGKPQNWSTEKHPNGIFIKKGDVIVGMDAEFKPCIWHGLEGYLNQRLFRASAKEEFVSNYFIYYSLEPLLAYEEQAQVGTTVAHLGKKDIDKFRIITPPNEILDSFKKQTQSCFELYLNKFSETETLSTLRDTLLPKLISGELRVGEVEKIANQLG